jgi:glucose-6-phosphate-specific signal transduction histidine kinase
LEREVDEFRRNLQTLKTEKQNQLLVSTSIVQDLQAELEKVQLSVKAQEEESLMKEDKKKDISRELSQTTQAIRNLFGRCFNTMRIKPVFAGHKDSTSLLEVLDRQFLEADRKILERLRADELPAHTRSTVLNATSTVKGRRIPSPPGST